MLFSTRKSFDGSLFRNIDEAGPSKDSINSNDHWVFVEAHDEDLIGAHVVPIVIFLELLHQLKVIDLESFLGREQTLNLNVETSRCLISRLGVISLDYTLVNKTQSKKLSEFFVQPYFSLGDVF